MIMKEREVERCGACRCLITSGKVKFCRGCGVVLCEVCCALPGEGTFRPLCWGCYMKELSKFEGDELDD